MSRLFQRFAVLAGTLVLAFGLLAPAADANASLIQFGRIQYDSPGTDVHTNASVNGEYFVVKNLGSTARSLKSFTVRDAQNHVYTFSDFTLGAGKAVKIHTGKGSNTVTDRYWGLTWMVWNNLADTARLRTPGGSQIDACGWTSTGPGYKICPT